MIIFFSFSLVLYQTDNNFIWRQIILQFWCFLWVMCIFNQRIILVAFASAWVKNSKSHYVVEAESVEILNPPTRNFWRFIITFFHVCNGILNYTSSSVKC